MQKLGAFLNFQLLELPICMELQNRVHEHRLFFDKLVELVPAKFYILKDEEGNSWHYGMSNAERAAAKQATRERLKKAKRDRLDPEKFTSTLHLIQQQRLDTPVEAKKPSKSGADANNRLQGKASRASSYEELRERLRKRMEILRAKRNADAAVATAKFARSWKNAEKQNSQNHKRKILSQGLNATPDLASPVAKRTKQATDSSHVSETCGVQASDNFEFGRVKMGLKSDANWSRNKHKVSKDQLLAKATKLQAEMQDAKTGQDVSMKHLWSAAVTRSSGDKVYDDPGLLKKRLKRDEHQRQRSSKRWEERRETVKQSAEAKQHTRQEHIKERKHQKKEKKIAKREEKLMRPGFEGRREKFINE